MQSFCSKKYKKQTGTIFCPKGGNRQDTGKTHSGISRAHSRNCRLQTVTFPVFFITVVIIIIIITIIFYYYYRSTCMEEKRIMQKQLKKVQNTNTVAKEEKGNWDSKRLKISKYTAVVVSILSTVMFLNTLLQKINTYPWPKFCAPHLTHQCQFYAAFFLIAEIQ